VTNNRNSHSIHTYAVIMVLNELEMMRWIPCDETNFLVFRNAATTTAADTALPNGKQVMIGILDTRVDLAAFAAADGNDTRLLDLIDCTGAGDVDVSAQVNAEWNEEEQCWNVTGLMGRVLYLPAEWNYQPFPTSTTTTSSTMTSTTKKEQDEEQEKQQAKNEEESLTKPEKVATGIPIRLGVKSAYSFFPMHLVA